MNIKPEQQKWIFRVLAWSLIGHYIYSIFFCFYKGMPEELFWISHAGTLLGGLGILFRNRLLISVALISLFDHHMFWVFEAVTWLITGKFPLGTNGYLETANIWLWLQTINHFYTVPALLVAAFLEGGITKHSWIWAGLFFSLLVAISFFFLPPEANVNCAHELWPGLEKTPLAVLSQVPQWQFPIYIVLINIFGNYIVVYFFLRLGFSLINRKKETGFKK